MYLPVTFNAVDGDVYCELVNHDSTARPYKRRGTRLLFLTNVYTAPRLRGNGLAGTLLRVVFAWAVATSTDLCTYAHGHPRGGSNGPDDWQLMHWYLVQGFELAEGSMEDPKDWMIWRYDQLSIGKNSNSNETSRKPRPAVRKKNLVSSI